MSEKYEVTQEEVNTIYEDGTFQTKRLAPMNVISNGQSCA